MMANRYIRQSFIPICMAILLLGFSSTVNAQNASVVKYKIPADTISTHIGYSEAQTLKLAFAAPLISTNSAEDIITQQNLQITISKAESRRILMNHLQALDFKGDAANNRSKRKFFFKLGNAFAHLRMYSLAMKCYFKTLQYKAADSSGNDHTILTRIDAINTPDKLVADTTILDPKYLGFNTKDDSVLNDHDGILTKPEEKETRSPKITYSRIIEAFKDGKKAVAYAMLLQVKQPVPGKRKVYHYTDSGHSFITLIKYNNDSTYVSVSFGFYPDKDHLLAGTPLFPSSPSVFRDDAQHKWDEVAGKFLSKRRFEKILALTKEYDGVKYNLNKNNCTDFTLNAAMLANITVGETTGSWPLGHGNNPGITGLSILNGQIFDGSGSLFISRDSMIKVTDK